MYSCEDTPNDSTPKDYYMYPQCEDCKTSRKSPGQSATRTKEMPREMMSRVLKSFYITSCCCVIINDVISVPPARMTAELDPGWVPTMQFAVA